MTGFHVALVPVGKIDSAEVEAAGTRAARAIRQPVELRPTIALPRSSEDAERGQHRAAVLLVKLRDEARKHKPGTLVGSDDPAASTPFKADGFVFITDADLFTAKTEGVFGALNRENGAAVVSLRRLREAFHRRKADPARQRARLVKEILRMWGRLQGVPECGDPTCAIAASRNLPDLDAKSEGFCAACTRRLFEGTVRI